MNNDHPSLLIKFIHLNCPLFRLHLSVSNGFVSTKIYDKHDDFDFGIVIVPVLEGDVLHPFIYSEANHRRHLIKITFIYKGTDLIDLPSIFKDKSVISSIPSYFLITEPPIVYYKYNKHIRNTIFNFKTCFRS